MRVLLVYLLIASAVFAQEDEYLGIGHFRNLLRPDERSAASGQLIQEHWKDSYAPMLIECLRFARSSESRSLILDTLRKGTGEDYKTDLSSWWQWVWKRPYQPHPQYSTFKEQVYRHIDSRFSEYFDDKPESLIRLDEVRWGGVVRDGIPPLKNPETTKAINAGYLKDDDVIFGVSFGGESRAYPKRILAWHEMVKDVVGGRSINGVYCTLCGSMIVYDTKVNGTHYELGTSGFLYRSNKLMYDHKTQSMWSTIEGKPVIGPLVGKGVQLKPLTVVTTTWKEWTRRHPETTVLTLNTGYRRDYGEGVAYRNYFATDELMFDIPKELKDSRLKNKDSVLALRFGSREKDKVAFAPALLKKNPLYLHRHDSTSVVILTDRSGASRVYKYDEVTFASWDQKESLIDSEGKKWTLSESALVCADGRRLDRFPSHNAFWFGWASAYPKTQLIE